MDVNPSLVTKVTEELLDSRIVEKASYSSWRLEKEQEKRKFFTAGLEEIQFELRKMDYGEGHEERKQELENSNIKEEE